MKLYYSRYTRAARPRWLLEELGLAYELVRIDLTKGEQREPAHLARHPHGQVPVLEIDGWMMTESAAIVSWLADAQSAGTLAPALGTPERAQYEQWLFYAMTTVEPPIQQFVEHTRRLTEDQRDPQKVRDAQGKLRQVAELLTRTLQGRDYLLGEFSAADVVLGSVMIWARSLKVLEDFPVVLAWCARLAARPAYKRSMAD